MRRVVLAVASTVVGLVLLLGFKTHPLASTVAAGTGSTGSAGSAGSTGSAGSAGSSGSGASTVTVTGDAVATRFGPVQVQVTVQGGEITDVTVLDYPDANPHDAQVNGHAIPVLTRETLEAGSADIDTVSGATYTSLGYITSLQSALDEAGL